MAKLGQFWKVKGHKRLNTSRIIRGLKNISNPNSMVEADIFSHEYGKSCSYRELTYARTIYQDNSTSDRGVPWEFGTVIAFVI